MGNTSYLTAIELQKAREMIRMIFTDNEFIIYSWQVILILAVSAAYVVTLWALMGAGLLIMAKNRNIKHAWIAFVPFVRMYLLGKLAGESRIFGMKIKNCGLVVMILSLVAFAFGSFAGIVEYYTAAKQFFAGEVVILEATENGSIILPYELPMGLYTAANVISIAASVVQLVLLFMLVTLYLDFFKTYAPNRFFFYALLVVFIGQFVPVDGFFVFALRNRKAVNYKEYMKEQYMRMQGTFTSPRPNPPDNPFREFGGRGDNDPGDPFDGRFGDDSKDAPDQNDGDSTDGADKSADRKPHDDDPFGEFDQ